MLLSVLRRALLLGGCLVISLGPVVSVSAQTPPDWSINPALYSNTMNVVGRVVWDHTPFGDPGDRLAAFVGDELRGVGQATDVGGTSLVFLTLYANQQAEALRFEAYDASRDVVVPLNETVVFQTDALQGTIADPFVWSAESAGCGAGAPAWTDPSAVDPTLYALSASVTAAVRRDDGGPVSPDDRLAAIVAGAVRGVAAPTDVGGAWRFFLTVYSNTEGESVTFRYYDARAGLVRYAAESLPFTANGIIGQPSAPLVLTPTCTAPQAVAVAPGGERMRLAAPEVYPNPFQDAAQISYQVPTAASVQVAVYDLLGRTVARLVDAHQPPGRYTVPFDAASLPSGRYLVRIEAAGREQVRSILHVQ